MIERCDRCKFCQRDDAGNSYCYRFPPVAALAPTPNGFSPIGLHPPVQGTHFCGEFKEQLVLLPRDIGSPA